MSDPRRSLPRTDAVLADARLATPVSRLGTRVVKQTVTDVLTRARTGAQPTPSGLDAVVEAVLEALPDALTQMRPVINASGVLVHTNLGRAPLSEAAVRSVVRAAGVTDVELDLATGRRGRRGAGAMAALAAAVPDAGGVHVVNNGAAALGLACLAMAPAKGVVIAMGEMVEIGDGFRIPQLLESFGAELRVVGTTNRVRVQDYAEAIDDTVGFILKVHPSNFRVEGFTASVGVADLAQLPVPVVADIGSGLLTPHPRLPHEPDAATALREGATLVTASGDKLLGGPQCGLLLGQHEVVERLRRHPAARALRVDKLTLAALEATLTGPPPPVPAALAVPVAQLRARAAHVADLIGSPAEASDSWAQVGGGGAPGLELPSAAVTLPSQWAEPLRGGPDPVLGRVHDGRLFLDLFAVPPTDDLRLAEAVRAVLHR